MFVAILPYGSTIRFSITACLLYECRNDNNQQKVVGHTVEYTCMPNQILRIDQSHFTSQADSAMAVIRFVLVRMPDLMRIKYVREAID
jgi:hypothetical protein